MTEQSLAYTMRMEIERLRNTLRATIGYMRNAEIDLATGAPKRTALSTIAGGIKLAEDALKEDPVATAPLKDTP